jgi:hypothetical protein
MNKPKAFFVVSEWNNDVSWVEDYTKDYIIFDKSHSLPNSDGIRKIPNIGYNVYDILLYITENYENLPDVVAFLEGNPFDHISKEKFDFLIYNECFTPLESYESVPESSSHIKGVDGGYMEINDNWYINSHIKEYGILTNRYIQSYNQLMDELFIQPHHPQWIRFSPGAQYIVPKQNILFYSKHFYEKLMAYVDYCRLPTEAMVIERALYTIFTNRFQERPDIMNELDILARKYGTDKRTNDEGENIYHGYVDIYYKLLSGYKDDVEHLLELGVREGWSHLMWHDYFQNAIIYGVDNLADVQNGDLKHLENDRIKMFVGDCTDKDFLDESFDGITFDIIIDDASHKIEDQVLSYKHLFPKLCSDGMYFIEDVEREDYQQILGTLALQMGGTKFIQFFGELGVFIKR